MMAAELRAVLEGFRFQYANEIELQNGIARALSDSKIEFEREVRLTGRDRIDFMAGRIGIEVKVGHPLSSVMRQVHRYMQSGMIDELLVVTNRCRHSIIPESINGKSVEVLFLGWGMLG